MNNQYWFKRRRYGWGWIPATWQGWTVIGLYLLIVLGGAYLLETSLTDELPNVISLHLAIVALTSAGLIYISFRYGPTPKWRWGASAEDNPEEDA